jgi:hypothetical protein
MLFFSFWLARRCCSRSFFITKKQRRCAAALLCQWAWAWAGVGVRGKRRGCALSGANPPPAHPRPPTPSAPSPAQTARTRCTGALAISPPPPLSAPWSCAPGRVAARSPATGRSFRLIAASHRATSLGGGWCYLLPIAARQLLRAAVLQFARFKRLGTPEVALAVAAIPTGAFGLLPLRWRSPRPALSV